MCPHRVGGKSLLVLPVSTTQPNSHASQVAILFPLNSSQKPCILLCNSHRRQSFAAACFCRLLLSLLLICNHRHCMHTQNQILYSMANLRGVHSSYLPLTFRNWALRRAFFSGFIGGKAPSQPSVLFLQLR